MLKRLMCGAALAGFLTVFVGVAPSGAAADEHYERGGHERQRRAERVRKPFERSVVGRVRQECVETP